MNMTEHKTFPGKVYAVTCPTGCTLTDDNGMNETVEAGKQFRFMAQTSVVYTSEPATVTGGNFKLAPAELLGLLGGGASTLPSGYLAAEFLEDAAATAGLITQYTWSETTGFRVKGQITHPTSVWAYFMLNKNYVYREDEGGWNQYFIGREGDLNQLGIIFTEFSAANTSFITGDNLGFAVFEASYNYLNDSKQQIKAEKKGKSIALTNFSLVGIKNVALCGKFSQGKWTGSTMLRIFNAQISESGKIAADFAPSVDKDGIPCMFDKVSKQSLYNSGTGSFVVGMTLKQARKLGKLPSTGGTLKVSLPSNYLEDEGVTNAIAAANAKGWNIEVASTFEADGASTTFALRRIWVRKTQDENGSYIDADGVRWRVESCVAMYNADGSEPDAHGYEPFRSVESATEYWGLTEWVDPEAEEELFTNTEEV